MTEHDLGECVVALTHRPPDPAAAGHRLVREAQCAAANARSRFESACCTALSASPTSAEEAVLTIHRLKQQGETIQAELGETIAAIKAEMRALQKLASRIGRKIRRIE